MATQNLHVQKLLLWVVGEGTSGGVMVSKLD